jgi:hypothetical protein
MKLPPAVTVAIHVAVCILASVATLGPFVAHLSGILPGSVTTDATAVVAFASAATLYLSSSPLFQPLLQFKAPATVIKAVKQRAATLPPPALKPSELPTQPELQGVVSSRPPPPNPPKSAA